jgi:predicted dehydrogenase
MFNICLIGCGDMAWTHHGHSINKYAAQNPGVRFAACCDIDPDKARKFKEAFNVGNCYTDIEAMLDAEKPQAVNLICPVELTADLSCLIMGKGYPLLVEKPPGLDTAETRRMMAAAKGVPNQVSFNRRYMPYVQKCLSLIGAGRIYDIRYRMARVRRQDHDFATTAIHGIDLVKYMAGSEYKTLRFTYRSFPELGPTVANFHVSGCMENGVIVSMDFLPISGTDTERLEINTDKGMFWLKLPLWASCCDKTGSLEHLDKGQYLERITYEDETYVLAGFYNENAFFYDDVRNGKNPAGDIASGLQSVEIADYLRRREAVYGA